MATGTTRKQPIIEYGQITSGSISASSYNDFEITFDQTFPSAPIVLATVCSQTATVNFQLMINTISSTTTTATIRVQNPRDQTQSLSSVRKIVWLAIG